jgi:hypothetical protein
VPPATRPAAPRIANAPGAGTTKEKTTLELAGMSDEAEGLSHEQVRRSINRSSIGRWKNYEFAFGPEWGGGSDAITRAGGAP